MMLADDLLSEADAAQAARMEWRRKVIFFWCVDAKQAPELFETLADDPFLDLLDLPEITAAWRDRHAAGMMVH